MRPDSISASDSGPLGDAVLDFLILSFELIDSDAFDREFCETIEFTSCSSRLMRESNCCLASVLELEIRFRACGENTHVV